MKLLRVPLVFVTLAACAAPRPAADRRFPLLNPLLRENPELKLTELHPFSYKINALLEERRKKGELSHAAVYFRDLENGPLRGINIDEKFTPASLLKVPLLIAALRSAEKDPSFLSRAVRVDIPFRGQSSLSGRAIIPGQDYTLEEVVRALVVHSDNDAYMLLKRHVPQPEQDAVFRDFGLVIADVRSAEDSMSVREYATFFRVLYNASYLGREMSQKALSLLAESSYHDGLVAGVPPGTVVAHKYGERFFQDGELKQLHDCGIVYHPVNHYGLCIMTRGKDFDELAAAIRDVSALVYAEVSAHRDGQ